MIRHRIMALVAAAAFVGFLGVVTLKLARVDLAVVVLFALALAAYDLWLQLGGSGRPR